MVFVIISSSNDAKPLPIKQLKYTVMNKTPFEDFDFSSFWNNNQYAPKYYVGTTPTDEQVKDIENYYCPLNFFERSQN